MLYGHFAVRKRCQNHRSRYRESVESKKSASASFVGANTVYCWSFVSVSATTGSAFSTAVSNVLTSSPARGRRFPRRRTAWLGVSGLQAGRHGRVVGGAKLPLLLSRQRIRSYRACSESTASGLKGIPSDMARPGSRYYPFITAAEPPRCGRACVPIECKNPEHSCL